MSKNIKVSQKHGLNPSISICFFCGEDKKILLLGKIKGDVKAPKRMLVDYKPCENCAKKLAQGCTVIEVTTTDNGRVPIQRGAWPTGRWCVISNEAASVLFRDTGSSNTVLLEDNLYEQLINGGK